METAYKIDDLRRLETMANTNEFEYGEHLVKILQTRKQAARRLLKSGFISEVELKELQSVVDYCNNLVCQVMGMPPIEKFNFVAPKDKNQ